MENIIYMIYSFLCVYSDFDSLTLFNISSFFLMFLSQCAHQVPVGLGTHGRNHNALDTMLIFDYQKKVERLSYCLIYLRLWNMKYVFCNAISQEQLLLNLFPSQVSSLLFLRLLFYFLVCLFSS